MKRVDALPRTALLNIQNVPLAASENGLVTSVPSAFARNIAGTELATEKPTLIVVEPAAGSTLTRPRMPVRSRPVLPMGILQPERESDTSRR